MNQFDKRRHELFIEIGDHRKMVLSTASVTRVTSRMMSIICIDGQFLFQTDQRSRKSIQLRVNPQASLCFDNLQIEGICREIGHPDNHPAFCALYEKYFPSAYRRYTHLEDERLFVLEPEYIKKWVYVDGEPFEEIWDFAKNNYELLKYIQR